MTAVLSDNTLDLSSFIYRNSEARKFCFSSTPLYDSLDYEDANGNIEFSNRGCHDLFFPSFDHDVDLFVVDISKPAVFDDLPVDEVETPQAIEALQPELMVMLGPYCLEVDFHSRSEICWNTQSFSSLTSLH